MSYKFLSTCLKCSLFGVFLLFFQPVFSQYSWSGFEQQLQADQKTLGNDVVALIWKGDTVIYKKELGDFNSAKTVAPLGSSSKWLTAALILELVDEGKIALEDPVVKYIPVFEKYFKNYITIRQCLSHMTGITDEKSFIKTFFKKKKFDSLDDEVHAFASYEIRANAGTDFWYGVVGLDIAARVAEVVTKKKFDQLIKQKIFNPLGMRKTTFSTTDGSTINPSGGAQSTPDDYIKFLAMLLNKGKYNGVQILSEHSVEMMRQIQTKPELIKSTPDLTKGYNYSLGSWVIAEKDGKASSLACPSLFGTWPVIDFCRGYAYIIFTRKLIDDEKPGEMLKFKSIVDKQIVGSCP